MEPCTLFTTFMSKVFYNSAHIYRVVIHVVIYWYKRKRESYENEFV